MPVAAGITQGFTLGAVTPTAIATPNTGGSAHRRLLMISNLDAQIVVYVAFGTGNKASTTVGHPIQPGTTAIWGGPAGIAEMGNAGGVVPPGDVSMIAASGTPAVAVTLCA